MKPFQNIGKLYLIPTTLGDNNPMEVLPEMVKRVVSFIDYYVVENEKVARRFIKAISPEKIQSNLHIQVLDKHNENIDYNSFLSPILERKNLGLMSDAGCPGVADPGAKIIQIAHQKRIQVVPLVGPSSILLAVMSSGLNGQNFAFLGYLPIDKTDRKQFIKQLEKTSFEKNQTQLFIETPYRNNKLIEDLLQTLHPETQLCIACDITLPTEYIKTKKVADWKKETPDLHHRPAIFALLKLF